MVAWNVCCAFSWEVGEHVFSWEVQADSFSWGVEAQPFLNRPLEAVGLL